MLKHEASSINGIVTATKAPVAINPFVQLATATLFVVEVVPFVVPIDRTSTAIAPEHGQ